MTVRKSKSFGGNLRTLISTITMALCASSLLAQTHTDHPLLKAYPGSFIEGKEVTSFDQINVAVAPPAKEGEKVKVQLVEGKITKIQYRDPDDRSSLERIRNYEMALKAAGFVIPYQCGKNESECSQQLDNATMNFYAPRHYLNARLARPQGDVWVRLQIGSGPFSVIDIIELKPMDVGMVKIDANALAGDIDRQGHVAVHGIFFDTAKAELKPESADALRATPAKKGARATAASSWWRSRALTATSRTGGGAPHGLVQQLRIAGRLASNHAHSRDLPAFQGPGQLVFVAPVQDPGVSSGCPGDEVGGGKAALNASAISVEGDLQTGEFMPGPIER